MDAKGVNFFTIEITEEGKVEGVVDLIFFNAKILRQNVLFKN